MKFKPFKFCIRTIPFFLISNGFLGAQNKVSMHVDFVSWGDDLTELEVREGEGSTPVSALAFRYSEPLKYTGPRTLALALGESSEEANRQKVKELEAWRQRLKEDGVDVPDAVFVPKADRNTAEGEIPEALAIAREKDPSLAALVTLPANSSRATVLLAPGPDGSLISHVFDDDPARHPLGKVRVHNFSPHPISLRFADGKSKELASGKDVFASAPGSVFSYELAYEIDGEWKVQENNLVSIRPNQQMHMVVLRNGSSFFSSSDGSRGGFMQKAFLRRTPK